jgi:protein transport protein SEC20
VDIKVKMSSSFESLQDRLTALQETTTQLRELIDRLATVQFQPGAVPLSSPSSTDLAGSIGSLAGGDGDAAASPPAANVATELAGEIYQILREEEDELELLREETADLRAGRPGSEAEHRKTRLREGVVRLEGELKAYVLLFVYYVSGWARC